MSSLRLKPGDEIIVPGFAFHAAANLAIQLNLVPKFADIDFEDYETCALVMKLKDKLNENPPAVNENEIHCKKYKVKIIDQSKVENLAWMDCKNAFQGGIANDGEEICVKRLIYHNPTNLELIELGTCN